MLLSSSSSSLPPPPWNFMECAPLTKLEREPPGLVGVGR